MPFSDTQPEIVAYKGFNLDWTCRGMQYEVGKTYTHDGDVFACSSGLHACEYPLDVFSYYPPGASQYAEVRQSGQLDRDTGDTKIASARLTVTVELSLHEMISRAVQWVFSQASPENTEHATGDWSAASATGYQSAASATGDWSAASATGCHSAASATGYQSAASATGSQGAASATGDHSAASATGSQGAASATGYQSAASATGNRGAASATGDRSAASATGSQGAASATGDHSAASATGSRGAASATGYQSAASATGNRSAAMAIGHESRVMGADGNALFLVYRDPNTSEIKRAWAGIVGRDGIRAGVWYSLGSDGRPVEVS